MHLQQETLLQGGKYKIVRFISAGGFGCTYEGLHVMLKKRVAIKEFFVKDFCNRDEATPAVTIGITSKTALVNKLKDKFIEEAQSVSTLNHSHIVNVYDVFVENGTAYYVMDYIDGLSLSDIVKRDGAISEKKAVKYILQVADALEYVHAHNRLHLDIKPANIMVDKDDNAILIDFGASKQYDEVEGENTSTLIGKTPGYAPLEQMGNDVVKFMPSTDIYALGATLYKVLTGITPPSATLLASGEELEPISSSVSKNVRNAVYQSMQINKNKRPQSVSDFVSIFEVKSAVSATPGVRPVVDEATLVVETEKPKVDPMAAERERLLKEALAKAEKEKAEAVRKAREETERRLREAKELIKEEERKRKEAENQEKTNSGCWMLVAFGAAFAFIIGGFVLSKNKRMQEPESIDNVDVVEVVEDIRPSDTYITFDNNGMIEFVSDSAISSGSVDIWYGDLNNFGRPHGNGTIEYKSNDKDGRIKYIGSVSNGKRSDQNAELTYKNGNSFKGSFVDDHFGSGILTLSNDGVYFKGTFKNDQPWNGKWYFIQDNSLYSTVVDGKEKTD